MAFMKEHSLHHATNLRHRSHLSESTETEKEPAQQTCFNGGSREDGMFSETNFNNSSSLDQSSSQDSSGKSLLGYFMTELTKHYRLEADASEFVERRDRVYTSVYTPKNLEKFLTFGFLQCLDSILYMVTFLPLRIVVALMRILTYPCTFIFMGRRQVLDASQVTDLLKGLILVVSCYITSQVDMSMIYHIVRGQSIMKFYVFFNMLDVMDKLVCQFGQDILDSLYWTAVEPKGRKQGHFGTFFHLVFATVYVVAHTMMILMQAIILNVAFNSHNKNLLTVMMSNNFVEIKVNVFKRVDKTNLCQITYSDVRERFHYLVLLFFVFVRNMKELQWNWDMAFPLLQDAAIVFLVEVLVDWIKHAFITKLSELSASHYSEFSLGLAQDIASSQKKHAFSNFSDQVCRRMGFTPMPLICLLYMVCISSFSMEGIRAWCIVAMLYICLISTKVLNSIVLLGWAQRLLDERDLKANSTGTVINSQTHPKKDTKKEPAPCKPREKENACSRLNGSESISLLTPALTEIAHVHPSNSTFINSRVSASSYNCAPPDASGSYCSDASIPDCLVSSAEDTFSSDRRNIVSDTAFKDPTHLDGYFTDVQQSEGISDSQSSHSTANFVVTHPSIATPNLHTFSAEVTCSPLPITTAHSNFLPPNIAASTPLSSLQTVSTNSLLLNPPPMPQTTPPSTTKSSIPSSCSTITNTSGIHHPGGGTDAQLSTAGETAAAVIRSPKRKHSGSSITSNDSFLMEHAEPTLSQSATRVDHHVLGDAINNERSWIIGDKVFPTKEEVSSSAELDAPQSTAHIDGEYVSNNKENSSSLENIHQVTSTNEEITIPKSIDKNESFA